MQQSPAADRNKQPILGILQRVLPKVGTALEIASGTGQHVAHFAAALPGWTWQPSDADPRSLRSIEAWCRQAGVTNVLPPVRLDVTTAAWPVEGPFDAVYCANLLHISPWETCAALMQGAARRLAPAGVLVTYGPYLEDGVAPAPGNLAFDADLRARDPRWGVRRLDDVAREAAAAGLGLEARFAMPANNLTLVFRTN